MALYPGYPEGHCDAIDADVDRDIGYLKAKQDAGAEFVVTQLFYCVDAFLEWLRKCRQAGELDARAIKGEKLTLGCSLRHHDSHHPWHHADPELPKLQAYDQLVSHQRTCRSHRSYRAHSSE